MTTTLDDRDSNWEGFMIGEIPTEFRDKICIGHGKAGFTRNPLDVAEGNDRDKYVMVCAECIKPSRVALVNCQGCYVWYFTMRIEDVRSDGNTRTEYFCEECRG